MTSAFRVQMDRVRSTVLADTIAVTKRPVIDTIETDLLSLLNRNSYEKGGFFLHMLRSRVGERAFFDAIRNYYAKHRHATALTDDLRAEMEATSKQNLRVVFRPVAAPPRSIPRSRQPGPTTRRPAKSSSD